ncbi:MAG TPA: hypothetical protein VMD31_05950, partial [Opitutaceae bacterium]|nr:hypothetical protein [Opitutaceae bacterium]
WVAGFLWFLTGRRRDRYAVFGWTYLVVVGAFIALKGKNYYVSPVYPIMFAGGAVALEQFAAGARWRWLRVAYPALLGVAGLVLLPMSVPLLSPEAFLRYERRLGLKPPEIEHQRAGPLPQYFADEFGWEDMVREIARVYHALPPGDQARTVIFSNNWGDAAAVDFFGPRFGLPHAICKNDSYWLWGPGEHPGDIAIILQTDGTGDRKFFASVEKAGRVEHPWSRRDEWYDIYVCRGPNFDWRTIWPHLKTFD